MPLYCLFVQYFVFVWVLTMVSSATFLKLPYMIKLTLLTIMALVYALLVKTVFGDVFSRQQSCGISLLDTGYERFVSGLSSSR